MPLFVVKNGRLQPRQKDPNTQNYRVIPYKSVNNPTLNDYFNHTVDQMQKEIQKIKTDYRNLIATLWKVFSEIDRTSYDPHVMFVGLKPEQIYDKISLIRSLNAYEPEQQSLRLSAIMKVDDAASTQTPDSNIVSQQSPIISKMREEIKQTSLYEIQEEEECCSNTSRNQVKNNIEKHHINEHFHGPNGHLVTRPSLSQLSAQKRQGHRPSFFLKEKISLALHEQQQLRQILQEQLQKMNHELDEKNEYLNWTIDQLRVRNDLIEKLKETIYSRDEVLQQQENEEKVNQNSIEVTHFQELLDEKDKEIGLLINSLIERTENTQEDIEYLTNSLRGSSTKNEPNQPKSDGQNNIDYSIDLEKIQKSVEIIGSCKVATSPILEEESQKKTLEEYSALKPKKMNFQPTDNITYLTKEHFIQAEKKSMENLIISNVKMTESVKVDKSPKNSLGTP